MTEGYFSFLLRSAPLLFKGAWMTVQVLAFSATISFGVGLVLGGLSCNRLRIPVVSWMAEKITFLARGIPFYVQLLIAYFVVPDLMGVNLDPFPAAVVSLGFCSSGYVAQFVRGALNAIPVAQWESAHVLGYSVLKTLRHIIFPQAFRMLLPQFNNELDNLLKTTAIVSSIGLFELTRAGMNIVSREMEPVSVYLTLGLFYLCLSALLNWTAKKLERRFPYVKS